MNPQLVREARLRLALTQSQLGRMLGYVGANVRVQMDDIETGRRPLRECQRRLLVAYLQGYRPSDWPVEGDLEEGR